MRFVFFFCLALLFFNTSAQKVEYRNDSIFVNGFYINSSTSKSTLDSILKSKGKTKHHLGHDSKRTYKITSYNYKNLGLIFSKYDFDATKLSIAIKLNKHSISMVDMSNMGTRVFKGELFIGENYMNDKKSIEQLQKLKNCSITINQLTEKIQGLPFPGIHSANIVYKDNPIFLLIDIHTSEVTCVFIN